MLNKYLKSNQGGECELHTAKATAKATADSSASLRNDNQKDNGNYGDSGFARMTARGGVVESVPQRLKPECKMRRLRHG